MAVGRGPSAAVPAKEEHRQGPHTGAKQVTKFKRIAGKKARSENDCRIQITMEQITPQIHSISHTYNHIIGSRRYSQFNATT